jgi:hypothetical protein
MTNNTQIDWRDTDNCPVHRGTVKAEYDFGSPAQPAATLNTYNGCQCCTVIAHDPYLCGLTSATYHTSYSGAQAQATYLKQQHRAKTR